jgi:hypothetical protein
MQATTKLKQERERILDKESWKLQRWSEDTRLALRVKLEELDKAIAAVRREMTQVTAYDKRLALARRERELERQRTEGRSALPSEHGRIEAERNQALGKVEEEIRVQGRVKQRTVIDVVHWRILPDEG